MPDKTKEQEAFEAIEQGVKDVYSSDNFKNYLMFLSKFHQYSFNNTMLILGQFPEATLIAGYQSWKKNFKRQVNKGEQAIKILAPYRIKIQQEIENENNEEPTLEEVEVTRFHLVNVFDISQTDGEPIPELITDLKGTSHDAEALIQTITEIATIPIEFVAPYDDSHLLNGAKGYYSITDDKIVINKSLDTIQVAKTLTHEYAHSILHKQSEKSSEQKEIEAESLAFVICNHFNIDTSDYSFGYIAAYANADYEQLKEILVNIQANAHEMIEKIEPTFLINREVLEVKDNYKTPIELEEWSTPFINELESELLKSGLYDYLTSPDAQPDYGREETLQEININLPLIFDKYPAQCYMFDSDYFFRKQITETIFQHFYANNLNAHPFIDNSIERKNYEALAAIAQPIFNEDVYYMKYTAPHALDFNVEKIGEGKIAMSHYFELNGDLMADPDVELFVDNENKLLIPKSYQMDSLGIYENNYTSSRLGTYLNTYLQTWITSIKDNHFKIKDVRSENFQYNIKDNYKELKKYCKENGIEKMMPKGKELIR